MKSSNISAKPRVIFTLSNEAITQLEDLAVGSRRSRSNTLEVLINRAHREPQIEAFLGGDLKAEHRGERLKRFEDHWTLDADYDADIDAKFLAEGSDVPMYFRPPGPEATSKLRRAGLRRDDVLAFASRLNGEPEVTYILTGDGETCEEEIEAIKIGLESVGSEKADLILRIFSRLLVTADVKNIGILWDLLFEASPKFAEANPRW